VVTEGRKERKSNTKKGRKEGRDGWNEREEVKRGKGGGEGRKREG
jgi:hypothetical protein